MTVSLREATEDDIETILKWRQDRRVYEGLFTQSIEHRPLNYKEHIKWWYSHSHWKRFIIHEDELNEDVGWLYIALLDYWSPEIGLGITGTLQGKGIGKQAVNLALDWLREHDYRWTHTTVLDNNSKAIRLFESLGYHKGERSRPGESWWFRDL